MTKNVLTTLTLILAALSFARAEEPRPLPKTADVREEEPWKKNLRAKLKKPVSFEFVDTPLGDVLKFLDTLTHATIILDPEVDASKTVINLRVANLDLESALKMIVKLADLDYDFRNQAVFIAKAEKLKKPIMEMVIYDVSDLTHPPAGSTIKAISAADLNDAIRARIRPESWDPTLGTSIEEHNGKLIVLQNPEGQALISELLEIKRSATPDALLKEEVWKNEVEKKLARKLSFEFIDTPLTDAIEFLRSTSGVTIIIEPKLVAAPMPHINLRGAEMPIKDALQRVAKLCNAEVQLRDRAVFLAGLKKETPQKNGTPKPPASETKGF